jgi:transposase
MPNGMRWVGLDVHAHASAVAVFDDGTGEVITRRVVGRPPEVLDLLRGLPRPARAVYEAGPTGYGLVRRARAEGIEMAVCSPGNIERRPGDRIKTDKRDAIRLARLFAAGDLRLVWVPSEEQEQLRDLVRCREDLRADLMRARHRLATFLLRRERYYPGPGERWTLGHRHWLSQQRFDDAASRVTYADYLHGHDVLLARRELVARELEQIAPSCVWSETIARLCCLRAISTLTALGLCAEIGDWRRFEHPDSLACYVGLVPSEHSSGQTRRPGKITKAGFHPRPPAAGRGGASLPPDAGGRRQARDPPTRPGPRADRPRLAGAAAPERPLAAAAQRPWQAGRRGHDRDRARTRRRLLGDRHRPLTATDNQSGASRRRGGPGIAHTRTSALSPVSHPPARGWRRSIADSGRCDEPRS